MSTASTIKAALAGSSALTALVGTNIAENAIEAGPVQFIVFEISETPDSGLDGLTGVDQAAVTLQCWAKRSEKAGEIADAAVSQLEVFDASQADICATVTSRTAGYDAELDMNAVILTVEWWQQ